MMLAGRFRDRDRELAPICGWCCRENLRRTLGCQKATKRTVARSGGLSVVDHENKDGHVAQFLRLQRHFCVLTGSVSDVWNILSTCVNKFVTIKCIHPFWPRPLVPLIATIRSFHSDLLV